MSPTPRELTADIDQARTVIQCLPQLGLSDGTKSIKAVAETAINVIDTAQRVKCEDCAITAGKILRFTVTTLEILRNKKEEFIPRLHDDVTSLLNDLNKTWADLRMIAELSPSMRTTTHREVTHLLGRCQEVLEECLEVSEELNSLARSPTSFIPPLYRLDDYELLLGRYGAYFGR